MPSIIPTISAAGLGAVAVQPFPDVTPFTIREGATYESILSGIRVWLRDELVPYLNDNSAEATFQENVDTMIDTVNAALGAQAATVTAALNAAVDEIVTADIPLTAALFTSMGVTIAPPPLGGGQDDTPALQPLLLAAQATGGTLTLRAGTYLVNLATVNSFQQPRIIGQGRDVTILKAFSNASPALRLKGGAGKLSGGFLSDFQIHAADAGGGIGLQLADPGGVKWTRLKFDGTLAEGIQFLSESVGAFCEFNSGDAYFKGAVVLPVHYKRTLGNESFHGSGITAGTVFETLNTSTSPVIVVDSNCFVYGAPLTASFFPAASNVPLIRNLNAGRTASFYGHLDIEAGPGTSGIAVVDPAQKNVFFHGTVGALTSGTGLTPGALIRTHKTYYIGTNAYASAEPYSSTVPITANPTTIVRKPGVALVNVEIRQGANYLYSYLLHFWPNPFNAGGVVTVLANPQSLNAAAFGAPVFTVNNGQLVITNANYPVDGSVVAYVSVNPQNVSYASDTFNYS